jgi:hypothetical protein
MVAQGIVFCLCFCPRLFLGLFQGMGGSMKVSNL